MALTMLRDLVDPEVLASMVSAKLPKKIKFSPFARIDTTLVGQAGSTIKVPKYAYIGPAEDVAEGVAMGTTTLSTSTIEATVKKAGKAIELTDESVLSGYGDPQGNAADQLVKSIADKVDNDCYDALCGASLVYDGTTNEIGYNGITLANGIFEDESDTSLQKVIYVHPNQYTALLNDSDFKGNDKFPANVMITGAIGMIAGTQVIKSKKVKLVKYEKDNAAGTITIVADTVTEDSTNKHLATIMANCIDELVIGDKVKAVATEFYANPIVILADSDPNEEPTADGVADSENALTIYLKRNVEMESDRDILKKTTVLSADEHYVAVLSNESKAVLAKFKA